MDAPSWITTANVAVVAGKGGVGKTTVTAAMARAAAKAGQTVEVISVDDRPGLGTLLGGPEPTLDPARMWTDPDGPGRIDGRIVRPDSALIGYLDDHGMTRVAKRFIATGAIDVLATTTPGIKDLLVLGKLRQIEQQRTSELVIVDAPAAGHAITFLQSARRLREVVSAGPIATQADEALEMLADPSRCQVVLVTLPEETPVNEAAHVAFELEENVGVKLAPVVVNGVWPIPDELPDDPSDLKGFMRLRAEARRTLTDTAARLVARRDRQNEQITRLDELLPLPQVHLQRRFTARLTPDDVDVLASDLAVAPVDAGAL